MSRNKIGILGPSEIAFRRFLPALTSCDQFEYVGVSIALANEWSDSMDDKKYEKLSSSEKEKADNFVKSHGGEVFFGYEDFLRSDKIDCVYIPLPPALHYKWAKIALECGKHVLLEKPFTTNQKDTNELIDIASANNLAVHENYAFCFHNQIQVIKNIIKEGKIGELRQIRAAFGFPYRGAVDFRYKKELGGGAVLDCGGYPVKLASLFLGETSQVVAASLKEAKNHDVDVFGSVTLMNDDKLTAQVAFGMDNSYKCDVEIWGSEGYLLAPRVFTPPGNMKPSIFIKTNDEKEILASEDDQFLNSIKYFGNCIKSKEVRNQSFTAIKNQSRLIDEIRLINSKKV